MVITLTFSAASMYVPYDETDHELSNLPNSSEKSHKIERDVIKSSVHPSKNGKKSLTSEENKKTKEKMLALRKRIEAVKRHQATAMNKVAPTTTTHTTTNSNNETEKQLSETSQEVRKGSAKNKKHVNSNVVVNPSTSKSPQPSDQIVDTSLLKNQNIEMKSKSSQTTINQQIATLSELDDIQSYAVYKKLIGLIKDRVNSNKTNVEPVLSSQSKVQIESGADSANKLKYEYAEDEEDLGDEEVYETGYLVHDEYEYYDDDADEENTEENMAKYNDADNYDDDEDDEDEDDEDEEDDDDVYEKENTIDEKIYEEQLQLIEQLELELQQQQQQQNYEANKADENSVISQQEMINTKRITSTNINSNEMKTSSKLRNDIIGIMMRTLSKDKLLSAAKRESSSSLINTQLPKIKTPLLTGHNRAEYYDAETNKESDKLQPKISNINYITYSKNSHIRPFVAKSDNLNGVPISRTVSDQNLAVSVRSSKTNLKSSLKESENKVDDECKSRPQIITKNSSETEIKGENPTTNEPSNNPIAENIHENNETKQEFGTDKKEQISNEKPAKPMSARPILNSQKLAEICNSPHLTPSNTNLKALNKRISMENMGKLYDEKSPHVKSSLLTASVENGASLVSKDDTSNTLRTPKVKTSTQSLNELKPTEEIKMHNRMEEINQKTSVYLKQPLLLKRQSGNKLSSNNLLNLKEKENRPSKSLLSRRNSVCNRIHNFLVF